MSSPDIIFGAASIGVSFTTKEEVESILNTLKDVKICRIDTAARYPSSSPGLSETLLGEAGVSETNIVVDTKIAIVGSGTGGTLSADAIKKSITKSLVSLSVKKVNVLYCHAPDNVTPLEEQAAALNEHYKLGQFDYLGISNFKPDMITRWMEISEEKEYIKPSVYQGQYNLFCRSYEEMLFPTLQRYGIKFVAFSPLAGGFLTGKLTPTTKPEDLVGTRFEAGSYMGGAFKHWYDKPKMHDGLGTLRELCSQNNMPIDEAALRWLVHHSPLKQGDGVILGASRVSQIVANNIAISKGPLADDFAKALDELWQIVKVDAGSIV